MPARNAKTSKSTYFKNAVMAAVVLAVGFDLASLLCNGVGLARTPSISEVLSFEMTV